MTTSAKTLFIFLFVFCAIHYTNTQNVTNVRFPRGQRAIGGLCPTGFIRSENICYFFSNKKETWIDAHFDCRDMKSRLAEPLKYSDRRLRKLLLNKDKSRSEKWIGGMYNWERMKWQLTNGKDMTYQGFAQTSNDNESLKYHCATVNPLNKYRWSAKLCTERHYYICQKNVPYVNEKNKQDLLKRLNSPHHSQGNQQTFPSAEKVHYNKERNQYHIHNRKHNRNEVEHFSYVPKAIQKKHINANLTGNVDLGMSFKNPDKKKIRKNKHRKRTRTTTTSTTTPIPETTESTVKEITPTPEPKVQQTQPIIKEKKVKKTTPVPQTTSSSTLSPQERKIKSAKLREKLARLTPEQRKAFFQAKRERAALKKKLNDTSSE